MPKQLTIRTAQGNLSCTVQGGQVSIQGVTLELNRALSALRCVLNAHRGMRVYANSGSIQFIGRKRFHRGWVYDVRIGLAEYTVKPADLDELRNMLEAHKCQSR